MATTSTTFTRMDESTTEQWQQIITETGAGWWSPGAGSIDACRASLVVP